MIITCKCKHKGQDSIHGKQRRVANRDTKKVSDKQAQLTCTVCGSKSIQNV